MTFLKSNLWPWLILGLTLTSFGMIWYERRFFSWVKEHWFFKRRKRHMLSSVFLLSGFAILSVILLDPRAGEIKIKGKIRQDKTIILIDTSTSMLAEDVRPNRLEKAVLIAKHFARKAVGHQIGVMVFADITKKLVPFTSDLDLLDARIDSIKQLRNMNAGSSIGLAIEEAVRFFDPKDDGVSGNILVITDGEDNADTESFKVPDGISVALVGVGTKAGAPIPMKDNFNMFYGQKKSHGVTVISKLNEEFFLNAVKGQKNARYFLAQSYDLPTQQILDFFSLKKGEEKEGENVVRPVAMEQWSVPALLLLVVAYLLRMGKPFAIVLCLFLLPAWAAKNEAPEIPPEIQARMEQLRKGELTREEKVNLADQLVKYRLHDQAQGLYEENLTEEDAQKRPESYFNWATSELETEKLDSALKRYNELDELSKKNAIPAEMREKIRSNIRRALVPPPKQDNKKNQEQDKQENQDQQQNSGSEGEGESGQSKNQKQQGQKGKDSKEEKSGDKNPFDPKNKDKGDDGEKGDKDKDKNKDSGDKDKQDDKEKQGQGQSEGEEGEKKQPKAKLSPLIENLKQDDRKLQLKLLDTSTQKRTERRKKDW